MSDSSKEAQSIGSFEPSHIEFKWISFMTLQEWDFEKSEFKIKFSKKFNNLFLFVFFSNIYFLPLFAKEGPYIHIPPPLPKKRDPIDCVWDWTNLLCTLGWPQKQRNTGTGGSKIPWQGKGKRAKESLSDVELKKMYVFWFCSSPDPVKKTFSRIFGNFKTQNFLGITSFSFFIFFTAYFLVLCIAVDEIKNSKSKIIL